MSPDENESLPPDYRAKIEASMEEAKIEREAAKALKDLEGPPLRAFIVRKESKGHGTSRQIEGLLEPGSRVVVVDDVVTTAGSTLRAIEAVEEAGHEIVAVICLVDREQGGTEKLSRWPFFPLFRRAEIFDAVTPDSP